MDALHLHDISQFHAVLAALLANAADVGVGVVDLSTGTIYLSPASALDEGDHASLVEKALEIHDVDEARALRGFVVGLKGSTWLMVNNSGLNPDRNRMESDVFEQVRDVILGLLSA